MVRIGVGGTHIRTFFCSKTGHRNLKREAIDHGHEQATPVITISLKFPPCHPRKFDLTIQNFSIDKQNIEHMVVNGPLEVQIMRNTSRMSISVLLCKSSVFSKP